MEYDKENWELKIEIRQGDIIPEDDDVVKCRECSLLIHPIQLILSC